METKQTCPKCEATFTGFRCVPCEEVEEVTRLLSAMVTIAGGDISQERLEKMTIGEFIRVGVRNSLTLRPYFLKGAPYLENAFVD